MRLGKGNDFFLLEQSVISKKKYRVKSQVYQFVPRLFDGASRYKVACRNLRGDSVEGFTCTGCI